MVHFSVGRGGEISVPEPCLAPYQSSAQSFGLWSKQMIRTLSTTTINSSMSRASFLGCRKQGNSPRAVIDPNVTDVRDA